MAKRTGSTGPGSRRPVSRRAVRIAWLWLALIVLAAVLGMGWGIGPIAWLDTWFALATGNLLDANVLFAMLILAVPSIWILFGAAAEAERRPQTAAMLARQRRTVAIGAFAVAGACAAMAAVAGMYAAGAPDGTEAAIPVSPEALALGLVPAGKVALYGASVDRAEVEFLQMGKNASTTWTYTGFRPGASRHLANAAAPASPPFAVFVEGARRGPAGNYVPPPQERIEGYLIPDGLPPYARIALERAGVAIAPRHYLLRASDTPRARYMTPLLLGLFFAAITALLGAVVLIVAPRAPRPDAEA